ncbi:type II toxin-antitoxin system RelE/ParE family toxin [Bradyrhizobium iriomotense]|uniref:Type II toxin-antitoxin system RelE/ParE family toxin n=1 Tax=Bradyrhizobium iriomotense TaxID=441950 RepID=A0ABQ6B0K9_9BRAD|nr:hypothetical protein GCM10007857_46390 [Bradyrhizobium iriomotense]
MPQSIKDIVEAFEFANTGGNMGEFLAFVCKRTGKIYYQTDFPDAAFTTGISSGYESLEIRIPMGYVLPVIRSFKGKFAEPILQGRVVPKGFPANLAKVARRQLIMVDSVDILEALNSPPGNRLEALKGDLAGKHSIRINDQWRVVFRWTDAGPEDVEIIDYR